MQEPRPRTIRLTEAEMSAMVRQAAEDGAKAALEKLGLHDEKAPKDLADLRDLLSAWRDARTEVRRTFVRILTTAILGAIATAVWLYAGQGQAK